MRGGESRWGVPCTLALMLGWLATGCQLDVKVKHLPPDKPIVVQVVSDTSGARDLRVGPEVMMEGARVFDERCSPCHGVDGSGNGPLAEVLPIQPRNYHEDPFKWGTRLSDIVTTISGGRSGVMPGFAGELTERQMWAAAYVVWSWIPPERRDTELSDSPPAKLQ